MADIAVFLRRKIRLAGGSYYPNISITFPFWMRSILIILYFVFINEVGMTVMKIKKMLMVGCVLVSSAACAMAQTTEDYYYQPDVTRSYGNDIPDDKALSLYTDDENDSDNFQKDAGLTLRNEKHTKRSDKRAERAYEQSAKKQKHLNLAEERKLKMNERAYLRASQKINQSTTN
jgi:hypothetical protein